MAAAVLKVTKWFSARRVAAARVLGGVGILVAFILANRALGPDSAYVQPFSSDSAIPVLMARERGGHGLFDAYYWGQDRLGAWPFLIARFASRLTGFEWTPEGLSAIQLLFVFSSALLMLVGSRRALLPGIALLASALLQPMVREHLLHLGQPVAWQLPMLVLAWVAVDRLVGGAGRRWLIVGLVAAALGAWSSPLTTPFLLLMAAVHMLARQRVSWSALGVIIGGGAFEIALRLGYHRSASAHFGHPYRTLIRGDTKHLGENLLRVLTGVAEGAWWPLIALAVAGSIAWLGVRIRSGGAKTPASLTFGAAAMSAAIANLAFCTIATHVRANDYGARYFVPSHLFFAIAAGCTLWALTDWAKSTSIPKVVLAAFPLALFLGVLLGIPPSVSQPAYRDTRALAFEMASSLAGSPILGGYWATYNVAALAPAGALLPVGMDRDLASRTPFYVDQLREGRTVILDHSEGSFLTPEGVPAPKASQYGRPLVLIRPRAFANGQYSLYRVVGDTTALPVSAGQ